jgi:hypothetical protein
MCDPVTATLVITAASAASSVYAQNQTAKAQSQANQRTYESNIQAYNTNIANANMMKTQEAENLSAQKIENNAKAQRDVSKATVVAGEGGVSGLSVGTLLAELRGSAGDANTNAEVNYLRRDRAIEMDRQNSWAGTANAINSLKTPQQPDYIGAGLRIAQAGVDYRVAQNKAAGKTTG